LARFSGGYKFHSNSAQDENKTLYFTNGYLGVGKATADTNATVPAAVSNTTVAMQVTGGITKLAQEGWTNLAVTQGPSLYAASGGAQPAYYKDSTERVYMRGLIHNHNITHRNTGWCAANPGSAIYTVTMATLPAGYRPEVPMHFTAFAARGNASITEFLQVLVTVEADGDVVYGYDPGEGYRPLATGVTGAIPCINELLYINIGQINFRAHTP
jgi:hypothetical protein